MPNQPTSIKDVTYRVGYVISGILMASGHRGIPQLTPRGYLRGWPGLMGLAVACGSAYLHLTQRTSPYSGPDAEIDDPITTLDLEGQDSERPTEGA